MRRPPDGNDHGEEADHPDLSGLAGEMRAEWREEQDAATADAVAHLRHGRTVTDWLRDRMHAGDRVGVSVTTYRFVGLVVEVGDDMLAMRCGSGLVEIHRGDGVPISFELVEHATQGGTRGSGGRTFRDALLARDGRSDTRVATVQVPDGIDGTLHVGRDFVSIATSTAGETIVPIAHVAWVTPVRS